MQELHFVIEGAVVSNNRVTRHIGMMGIVRGKPAPIARALKSRDSRVDEERIRSLARIAAFKARWRIPPAAALYIMAWNARKDVDNISKCIEDALAPPHRRRKLPGRPAVGPVLRNDRDLVGLHVEKGWDRGGERYEIRVEEREPRPKR